MGFGMDSGLYKAIQQGNVHGMKQLIIANHDQSGGGDHYLIQATTTSLNSNPLHIAAQFNQLECLEEIFCMCPSLLMKQNSEGDTALHIASRLRLDRVVLTLIGWAADGGEGGGGGLTKLQQLVRMTNKKSDTPLHQTLQYAGPSTNLVIPLLVDADPGFEYVANDAAETPLYLAVKNATLSEIEYILDKSPCQDHGGGRTVLHTAVLLNDYFRSADTVKILLKRKPHLVKEVDKDGRSALHYAASLYRADAFASILDVDSSLGYLKDKDGMTALHYVAGDHFFVNPVDRSITYNLIKKMTRKLAECCPDCWEMRDNKGRNFLHIAAENKKVHCFNYIFKNMPSSPTNDLMVTNLLNRRENNGKTPYDLLLSEEVPNGKVPEEFLADRDKCLSIIKLDPRARHFMHPRRDYDLDASPKNREQAGKIANNNEQPQDLEGQANMVVATLLATIAFAAAFKSYSWRQMEEFYER